MKSFDEELQEEPRTYNLHPNVVLLIFFMMTVAIITLFIWLSTLQSGAAPLTQASVNGAMMIEGELYVQGDIINSQIEKMEQRITELEQRIQMHHEQEVH